MHTAEKKSSNSFWWQIFHFFLAQIFFWGAFVIQQPKAHQKKPFCTTALKWKMSICVQPKCLFYFRLFLSITLFFCVRNISELFCMLLSSNVIHCVSCTCEWLQEKLKKWVSGSSSNIKNCRTSFEGLQVLSLHHFPVASTINC